MNSYEVLFKWPVRGGWRSDAYIVDTRDPDYARKVAKKTFRHYHPNTRDVEISLRRCNSDGTT